MNAQERAEWSRATQAITGRIFCTSCQSLKPSEGGKKKLTSNGRKRFVCSSCRKRGLG